MSSQERYDVVEGDYKILGEPLTLPFSGLVAKTRFLKGATSEHLATWDQHDLSKRGIPTNLHFRAYEEFGKGEFGIIIPGNVIINPIDLEAPGNLVLYEPFETPERLEAFRRLAEVAKSHGSLVYGQLSHGGRQVQESLNPHPVSASDVQLISKIPGFSHGPPTALTKEGIKQIVNQFAYAAHALYRAGFHGVELHGAHGYLIAQFLSQTTNKRTDDYGGSLQNRARFVYEIVEGIKAKVADPKFSVAIKLNSVEFQEGGFTPEECAQVCKHLEEIGVDWIELSGGTYENLVFNHQRESTKKREAFFIEWAELIRPNLTKTKLFVTGGFRTAAGMANAIKSNAADGIGLGRPICEEPLLPKLILSGEVLSARKTLIDENNFMYGNILGGSQLRQLGEGQVPINTTDPEVVTKYLALLQDWFNEVTEEGKKGVIVPNFPIIPPAKVAA